MLIHPRDLFPANMKLTASKPPRPAVPELGRELVMALELEQVLVPGQVLVLEQVLVLVPVLEPELVLVRHIQPPPNRSP